MIVWFLQLQLAMDAVRFDKDVRVVVVRSEVPGVFCAGRQKLAPHF